MVVACVVVEVVLVVVEVVVVDVDDLLTVAADGGPGVAGVVIGSCISGEVRGDVI